MTNCIITLDEIAKGSIAFDMVISRGGSENEYRIALAVEIAVKACFEAALKHAGNGTLISGADIDNVSRDAVTRALREAGPFK